MGRRYRRYRSKWNRYMARIRRANGTKAVFLIYYGIVILPFLLLYVVRISILQGSNTMNAGYIGIIGLTLIFIGMCQIFYPKFFIWLVPGWYWSLRRGGRMTDGDKFFVKLIGILLITIAYILVLLA